MMKRTTLDGVSDTTYTPLKVVVTLLCLCLHAVAFQPVLPTTRIPTLLFSSTVEEMKQIFGECSKKGSMVFTDALEVPFFAELLVRVDETQ